MLRIRLSVNDMASVRLAYSPLWEVVASVRIFRQPPGHAIHRPWQEAARHRLAGTGLDLLTALVPVPTRVLPGFLAPTPTDPAPTLDEELHALAATPADAVRAALTGTFGRTLDGPLADLYTAPRAGLDRLVGEIRAYWAGALAVDWPRIRTALTADVTYRARRIAQGGLRHLLADLDPAISWSDDVLTVRAARGGAQAHQLAGRGLVLVPSAFVWPRVFHKVSPLWTPVLRYPCRATGALWQRPAPVTDGLARVLGESRARLLTELSDPASTTELAGRTGLTPSAVSQHLSRLRDAGLVTAQRSGNVVLYARTATADALLPRDS